MKVLAAVTFLASAAPAQAKSMCGKTQHVTVPLPDPLSGRRYEIYVSLPVGYAEDSRKSYPLLLLADGGRAFGKLSCEVKALAQKNAIDDEPVVVGLSYATGENLEVSRRRDYTPVARWANDRAYGGAAAYQAYLRDVVLRYVESHYRTAPDRRIFWGHSYGGLLGAHIFLTSPELFQTYILGSPSFWYADGAVYNLEETYVKRSRQLSARVLLYVGGSETSRYDTARKGNTRDMVAGMRAFEERIRSRNYEGLLVRTRTISRKDHISSVRPGFAWGLVEALPPE